MDDQLLENQSAGTSQKTFSNKIIGQYTYAYFDHLHSEYLRIVSARDDEKTSKLRERLDPIARRREKEDLAWDDVYAFDLELLDHLSDEDLVRKAYDMRSKYRSIAGARDYDSYIASKPPDLATLQLEDIRKDDQAMVANEVLRADIRYLLGQFYLYYSLMPLREELRDELTRRARKWTLIFLSIFGLLLVLNLIFISQLFKTIGGVIYSTVGVVIFAGIMGGCVSMLQRIQSAPNEGDALYNLAALSHGWKGISLSPLYGSIFAMLLYVLFIAGILQGAVFPQIAPPPAAVAAPSPAAPASSNPPPASSAAVASSSTTMPFSGAAPVDAKSYALLVIWSFIAGFAERLVPDTLNRLVSKNQSIQGTTS